MLMSYPLTRGLLLHGQCGCAFLVLLLLHHIVNNHWYRSLFGRWQKKRIVLNCMDILLLLATALMVISALFMAGEVFTVFPYAMPWWARGLHMSANAWLFVLVSCHLGLHGAQWWEKTQRTFQRLFGRAWWTIPLGIMGLGAWRFIDSGLWVDMFFLGHARYVPETLPLFLMDCAVISLAWAFLARCLQQWAFCGWGRKGDPRQLRNV